MIGKDDNSSLSIILFSFQTSDGTAKAPGDYTAEADGELVFKPGEIYKELEVSIVENYKSGNRTLSVTLKKLNSPSVEVTLSGLTEVDITIIDSGKSFEKSLRVSRFQLTLVERKEKKETKNGGNKLRKF